MGGGEEQGGRQLLVDGGTATARHLDVKRPPWPASARISIRANGIPANMLAECCRPTSVLPAASDAGQTLPTRAKA